MAAGPEREEQPLTWAVGIPRGKEQLSQSVQLKESAFKGVCFFKKKHKLELCRHLLSL